MFILNISRNIVFVMFITLISGCGISSFSNRIENPVIESDTNDSVMGSKVLTGAPSFSSFATTASRRTISILEDRDSRRIEICSEPSPDVGEALASAISDALVVKAPIQGVPLELSNQYAHAISTQIGSLIYRTQGLQLYRDAIHNLCIDRMNSWFIDTEANNTGANKAINPKSYDDLRKL